MVHPGSSFDTKQTIGHAPGARDIEAQYLKRFSF